MAVAATKNRIFSTSPLFAGGGAVNDAETQVASSGNGLARPQQTKSGAGLMGLFMGGGGFGMWPKMGDSSRWPWLPSTMSTNCDGNNPWGWLHGGRPWIGSFGTYDWILKHPKVRHVLQDAINPIYDGTWEVIGNDSGVTKKMLDTANKIFLPLRKLFIDDAWRCLPYGTVPFEVVWRRDNFVDLTVPDRLVSQSPGTTELLRDESGNFAGIRPTSWTLTSSAANGNNGNNNLGIPYLGVLYSMIVRHDAFFGSLWGQSILENIRETSWRGWLKAFYQTERLGEKVSGILGMLLYPGGTYLDDQNNEYNLDDSAKQAIQGLMKNQFVTMKNLSLSGANPREVAELATKSLVDLKVVDMGNQAQAITGFVELLLHHENGISEGLMTSPRVNSQAKRGGGKADAVQHTLTVGRFSEKLNVDFAESWNGRFGLINNFFAFNYGEEFRGRVKIQAMPITDERKQALRSFVAAGMNVPQVAGTYVKMVDNRQILETIGIPVSKDADPSDLNSLVVPAGQANANPENVAQPNRPVAKTPDAKIDKAPSDKGVEVTGQE